jgi:hypothetical protein
MSQESEPAIVCELGALSPEERRREQTLLSKFRTSFTNVTETGNGFRVTVSAEPTTLSELGEFLAYERRCCPFLTFEVVVEPQRGPVTLHVFGGPGSKEFTKAIFLGQSCLGSRGEIDSA